MAVVRLVVPFASLNRLAAFADTSYVMVSLLDADTIVALGSLQGRLTSPLGVWLELSDNYAAQVAARDVATLSWLVPIDAVVISASRAAQSVDVVAALLSDEEVNFANDVATLSGAYNRPAPPRPIAVWSFDGTELRCGDEVLHELASSTSVLGGVTTYT